MMQEIERTVGGEMPGALYEKWSQELSEIMGASTRRGMVAKAARGGLPGYAPVGYVNRKQGYNTWVEVDPVQGLLVKEAFELVADGHSIREIVAIMTEKGLRSKRGNVLSTAAMTRLFRNPFYSGRVRLSGHEYPGTHEPLISANIFAAVQRRLTEGRRKGV